MLQLTDRQRRVQTHDRLRLSSAIKQMLPHPQFLISKLVLILFLVACTRLYNPLSLSIRRSVGRLVGWSVGRSVGHILLFLWLLFLWPHGSCPKGLVTSNMAPAHPHATSVAVYPALFLNRCYFTKKKESLQIEVWEKKGLRDSGSWCHGAGATNWLLIGR